LDQVETAPVAINGPGPRVGRDAIARVFLVENHDEAYPLWRASGAKHKTLIHVDAHHDIWWAEPQAPITIANFISRALQEEIVREVYWIVPDRTWKSAKNRRHVIRHFQKIAKQYPGKRSRAQIEKKGISATLLGKPLHICALDSLPLIAESVLLDIDVDFLLLPRVTYGVNDPHPVLPWCWPEELLARLNTRGLCADLATIAYSVEGGYTPLKWKYLGDELALRLRKPGATGLDLQGMARMREAAQADGRGELAAAEEKYQQARALLPGSAAPVWHLAKLYSAMDRQPEAQRMYQQALTLDPSYRTAYNSTGAWSHWNKEFSAAEREHRRILELDPLDACAHLGLAWLEMREKKWSDAEALLRRALELDGGLLDAYRALGDVLVWQGRGEEAIGAYEESLKLALGGHKALNGPIVSSTEHAHIVDPGHWRTYLQLARLYERKGAAAEAISRYRMSAAGGCEGVFLRFRLARLYLKQREGSQAARETWQAVKLLRVALGNGGRKIFDPVRQLFQHAYEAWLSR